eukprot:2905-Heterococcus_DN1.PRE.3
MIDDDIIAHCVDTEILVSSVAGTTSNHACVGVAAHALQHTVSISPQYSCRYANVIPYVVC